MKEPDGVLSLAGLCLRTHVIVQVKNRWYSRVGFKVSRLYPAAASRIEYHHLCQSLGSSEL